MIWFSQNATNQPKKQNEIMKWHKTIAIRKNKDKSSDIEQQPPFGDRKYSTQSQKRWRVYKPTEHHIILTKYEAVHPTAVSEMDSSSGMLKI